MKSKILYALACLMLSFGNYSLFAQHDIPGNVIPPAPEAAKIAEYGLIPTNLYTGAVSYSLPLYNLKFDGMNLPISLSYGSRGLKPSEEAGNVGLGWSLNVTGIISRVIMGADDLVNTPNQTNYGLKGWVYNDFEVPELDYSHINDVQKMNAQLTPAQHQTLGFNKYDTEPDIFNFNLFGYSGRFVLAKKDPVDGIKVIKLEEDATKITYSEAGNSFTIWTPNGYKATFDVKGYTTNISGVSTSSNKWDAITSGSIDFIYSVLYEERFRRVTSWYLSKIESPNGRVVNFNYDLQNGKSKYISISAPVFGQMYNQILGGIYPNNESTSASRIISENVYLTSIDYDEVNIQFSYDNRIDMRSIDIDGADLYLQTIEPYKSMEAAGNILGPKKVTGIQVKDGTVKVIKDIDFLQSYFNNNLTPTPVERWKRLKLEGVSIDGLKHEFTYHNPNQLPDKSTMGIDYWGYYNGYDNNERLLPAGSAIAEIFACRTDHNPYIMAFNRKADPAKSQIGVLSEVTFPTGGKTSFEYEAHDYLTSDIQVIDNPVQQYSAGSYENTAYTDEFYFSPAGLYCSNLGIQLDVVLGVRDWWSGGCCAEDLPASEIQNPAIVVINTDTGQEWDQTTWSYLKYDATNNNYTVSTKFIPPAPGNFKIKVNRIAGSDGRSKYYANVTAKVYRQCTLSNPAGIVWRNQQVGGLRIKAMRTFDTDGELALKKSYKYNSKVYGRQDYTSGKLMTPIRFIWENGSGVSDCYTVVSTNNYVTLADVARGYHIGYDHVEEFIESNQENTANNGSILQYFHNVPNDFTENFGMTPREYQYANGQLKEKIVYNQAGQVQQFTRYEDYDNRTGVVLGLKYIRNNGAAQATNPGDPTANPPIPPSGYLAYVNFVHNTKFIKTHLAPRTKVVRDYYGAVGESPVETTTNYVYNDHFLLQEESMFPDENGNTSKTVYVRPTDYSSPSATLSHMINNYHMIEPVIETKVYVNNQIEKASGVRYRKEGTRIRVDQVLTYNKQKGSYTAPAGGTSFNNTFESEAQLLTYDNKGNLVEFTSRKGIKTVIIWGYDQLYPVARVENATLSQVELKGVNRNGNYTGLSGTQISNLKSIPGSQVTTYTYQKGIGVATITDHNGLKTTYVYDEQERLKRVLDQNNHILKEYDYHYINQN